MVLLSVLTLAMALPLGHYLNLTLLTVLLKILITPYNPYYLVGVFSFLNYHFTDSFIDSKVLL